MCTGKSPSVNSCVLSISVLELHNSRFPTFLYWTGRSSSIKWAECLTNVAIKPHFVAFPACVFGTQQYSGTPATLQDPAGFPPGAASPPWKKVVSLPCPLETSTSSAAGKTGTQNTQGLCYISSTLHNKIIHRKYHIGIVNIMFLNTEVRTCFSLHCFQPFWSAQHPAFALTPITMRLGKMFYLTGLQTRGQDKKDVGFQLVLL